MNRTADISIGINAYDDETEKDRIEFQSKLLNMMIDFCRENIDGYVFVGCTVKDDEISRVINLPKRYKYK